MTARPALTSTQRDLRKQDLLWASQLARGQALIAIGELGGRADAVADRLARVRDGLANPWVWTLGSAVLALWLTVKLRQRRRVSLWRWIGPAWRVWRSVSVAVAGYRAVTGRSGRSTGPGRASVAASAPLSQRPVPRPPAAPPHGLAG